MECVPWNYQPAWGNSPYGLCILQRRYWKCNPSTSARRMERSEIIWFKGNIGKHVVCTWMVILDGLKTKVSLTSNGFITNSSCVFCNVEPKWSFHLFGQYACSMKIYPLQNLELTGNLVITWWKVCIILSIVVKIPIAIAKLHSRNLRFFWILAGNGTRLWEKSFTRSKLVKFP